MMAIRCLLNLYLRALLLMLVCLASYVLGVVAVLVVVVAPDDQPGARGVVPVALLAAVSSSVPQRTRGVAISSNA